MAEVHLSELTCRQKKDLQACEDSVAILLKADLHAASVTTTMRAINWPLVDG
jgi:hypothetical protein